MRGFAKHTLTLFGHWFVRQPRFFYFMLAYQMLVTILIAASSIKPDLHFVMTFYVWFFPLVYYGLYKNHKRMVRTREANRAEMRKWEEDWAQREKERAEQMQGWFDDNSD